MKIQPIFAQMPRAFITRMRGLLSGRSIIIEISSSTVQNWPMVPFMAMAIQHSLLTDVACPYLVEKAQIASKV